jgi:CRISPR-associated protein Cas5d
MEVVGNYKVRVRGPLACYTRPELKTERVSYEVITPSAARGVLEAVLWKPAIFWHIRRICLLSSPRFVQFKRNEVNSRISVRNALQAERSGDALEFYADDDRAQRNTVALRDVDYAIEAEMLMTPRRGPDDNARKFHDMFCRRLERGQFYMAPYLGCREFPAIVEPYDGSPSPITSENRDLGLMLHDIRYGNGRNQAVYFRAHIKSGVIEVPRWEVPA